MRILLRLKPGTRFRLAEMPEVTGVLVKVNDCRAVVRLDRPQREIEFEDRNGETRQFRCGGSQVTSWAPTTVVEPIGFQTLKENDMTATTTKKAAKSDTAKTKATKAEKAPKVAKGKTDGTMSGLDAAAKVLAEAGTPLKCTEIAAQAVSKGYWQTNGQTPSATLYSAMLREINVKGKESRFRRTDKGTFARNE